MTPTLIRRPVPVFLAVALPLLTASPARAEVPEGWSDPEEVGLLDLLLVIGAVPVVIAALITLAVYLPALSRGERVRPHAETPDEWFGGPRRGRGQLESGQELREIGTGGGSGTW